MSDNFVPNQIEKAEKIESFCVLQLKLFHYPSHKYRI